MSSKETPGRKEKKKSYKEYKMNQAHRRMLRYLRWQHGHKKQKRGGGQKDVLPPIIFVVPKYFMKNLYMVLFFLCISENFQ